MDNAITSRNWASRLFISPEWAFIRHFAFPHKQVFMPSLALDNGFSRWKIFLIKEFTYSGIVCDVTNVTEN